MSDYQKMVDDIQAMLASESEVAKGDFTTMSAQYTEAAREVNSRLRACDQLLQKGHRAEAIQQCEVEPNLLVAVALLDFPGSQQWADLIEHSGLPRPPELLIDVAGDLNEAYTVEQPLEHLMQLHRLHALARSPLQVRIGVMRKLRRQDRMNPIWEDDIREFEKVRHRQLVDEVEMAGKAKGIPALQSLEREIQSPDWLVPPPQRLVTRTVELHTRLRREKARSEMEVLEKELTLAFSNLDVPLGRELRERWNECAAIGSLPNGDDPLLEMAAPALEWLDQQDREEQARCEYDTTIAALEHALDDGQSRAVLERLYHTAARYEWGVPDILKRRLSERFLELDVTAGRRFRLLLVGIVLAVLLMGGLTGFGIFYHLRNQEIALHVSSLEQLIQEERYEEADKYLRKLEEEWPELIGRPEMQALQGNMDAGILKENQRTIRRRRFLDEAQEQAKKSRLGHFRPAYEAADQAHKLSKTAAEIAEVEQLQRDIRNTERKMQEEIDGAFTAELDDWQERVLQVLSGDDVESDSIRTLANEGSQLRKQLYVSSQLKTPIDPLIKQLDAKKASFMERKHMRDLLAQITAAVGNREEFASMLRRYSERHSETTRAVDFKRVVEEEAALWEMPARWDRLIDKWSRQDLRHVSAQDAAALVTEAEALLAEDGDYPAADDLKELVLPLQIISRREKKEQRTAFRQSLHDLFNNRFVVDLQMVQAKDGKRYYFMQDPTNVALAAGIAWSFRCVIDFELIETRLVRLFESEIANPREGDTYDWTAPQAKFGKFASEQVAKLDSASWESTFHAILVQLHRNPMEPVLKLQLMRGVGDIAGQGSYFLAKALQRNQMLLQDAQVDVNANWLDPENVEGERARRAAEQALRSLDEPTAVHRVAAELFLTLNPPKIRPRFTWIGWLCRMKDNDWTCPIRKRQSVPASAELFVFCKAPGGDAAQFHKIGALRQGTAELDSDRAGLLAEGRPVFAEIGAAAP